MFNFVKSIPKPTYIIQFSSHEVFRMYMNLKKNVNFDVANFQKYMFNRINIKRDTFKDAALFDRKTEQKMCFG